MKTIEERKAGTVCSRCHNERWPFQDWTEPYTCQRCQEVLRGGNGSRQAQERSPAQQAATRALVARRRPRRGRFLGEQGGVDSVLIQEMTSDPSESARTRSRSQGTAPL